jgi:hypothetical protein
VTRKVINEPNLTREAALSDTAINGPHIAGSVVAVFELLHSAVKLLSQELLAWTLESFTIKYFKVITLYKYILSSVVNFYKNIRYEVIMAVIMGKIAFWEMTLVV